MSKFGLTFRAMESPAAAPCPHCTERLTGHDKGQERQDYCRSPVPECGDPRPPLAVDYRGPIERRVSRLYGWSAELAISAQHLPLWTLCALRAAGITDRAICDTFCLEWSVLQVAWEYVAAHPDELQRELVRHSKV